MVVIGTSGVVYPVAYLPQVAKENGAHVIDVNLDRTPISEIADEVFLSPAGEIIPKLFGVVG
jgi:NAD-dependent deacetylase